MTELKASFEGISMFKPQQIHKRGFIRIEHDLAALEKIFEKNKTNEHGKKNVYYQVLRKELDLLSQRQKDKVWSELERYIPKYFRNFMDSSQKVADILWSPDIKQGNHHSNLTIMALTLELDGAFESEDALHVLQTTIEII